MISWNDEINKTLAKAGVNFEDVPVYPAMITINWLDGKRQIYKTYMNYLYVVGIVRPSTNSGITGLLSLIYAPASTILWQMHGSETTPALPSPPSKTDPCPENAGQADVAYWTTPPLDPSQDSGDSSVGQALPKGKTSTPFQMPATTTETGTPPSPPSWCCEQALPPRTWAPAWRSGGGRSRNRSAPQTRRY